jgi:hypothetical protein
MRELVNRARGEVPLRIGDVERRLCVTLGALAELEAAFDVGSLSELAERMARLTASDLILILAALVAGGGEAMSAAEIASARIDPKAAAAAVAEALRLAFDGGAHAVAGAYAGRLASRRYAGARLASQSQRMAGADSVRQRCAVACGV